MTKEFTTPKICEVCKQEEATDNINLGLDVGYHFADYGKGDYQKFVVKPTCISVTAIHLCSNCKYKIEKNKYFNVDVLSELGDLIKGKFIKNMILEGLK